MSPRNVRFADNDSASITGVTVSNKSRSLNRFQPSLNAPPYVAQSPPRPSDITFARDDAAVSYAIPHRRTPSDSVSSSSNLSIRSTSSSPEHDNIPLPMLDECLLNLPSGVPRPFDCDLSVNPGSSGIPSHMLQRPACEPPVQCMDIDMGLTAVQVHVGNPSLGYVAVEDVLTAAFVSLRRPLPRDHWLPEYVEVAGMRRKRLGKAEPREVLLIDMLGYNHFFHGLQEGADGTWQAIFGPRKV